MRVINYNLEQATKYIHAKPADKSKFKMFIFEDGSRLFVRANLKKKNVLVIPGLGGNISDRVDFLQEVEHKYGTIYFDFPGFGNSNGSNMESLWRYYNDLNYKLNKVFKHLGVKQLSVISNCFGSNYFLHNFEKLNVTYDKLFLITPNSREFTTLIPTKILFYMAMAISPLLELLFTGQKRQRFREKGFKIVDMAYYDFSEGLDTIYEFMKVSNRKRYRRFCKLMFPVTKMWKYYQLLKRSSKVDAKNIRCYFFAKDHFIWFYKKWFIRKFNPIIIKDIMHFNYRLHGIKFYKQHLRDLI